MVKRLPKYQKRGLTLCTLLRLLKTSETESNAFALQMAMSLWEFPCPLCLPYKNCTDNAVELCCLVRSEPTHLEHSFGDLHLLCRPTLGRSSLGGTTLIYSFHFLWPSLETLPNKSKTLSPRWFLILSGWKSILTIAVGKQINELW